MATRFLIIGFVAGLLAMAFAQRAHEFTRGQSRGTDAPVLNSRMSEEFESIERTLRDPRDREWNLLQDMQPCFPGSKLCFLLSGGTAEPQPGDR